MLVAGAVGLAVVGSLFTTLRSADIESGQSAGDASASALGDSLFYVAALLLVGVVVAGRWLPGKTARSGATAGEQSRHRGHLPLHHV